MTSSKGGAPKGNKNAVKLTTLALKEQAYQQYCQWIASGRSKEGWTFKHPELSLTHKSMEKYIKEDPVVFPSINKELAEADSFANWETRGLDMISGRSKAEPALYQMFMRNKFGWDKEGSSKDESPRDFDLQLEIIKPVKGAK
jgi:hypothetical protein